MLQADAVILRDTQAHKSTHTHTHIRDRQGNTSFLFIYSSPSLVRILTVSSYMKRAGADATDADVASVVVAAAAAGRLPPRISQLL